MLYFFVCLKMKYTLKIFNGYKVMPHHHEVLNERKKLSKIKVKTYMHMAS